MFIMHDHTDKYRYCANTFDKDGNPVQRSGYVYGESEEDAIRQLIKKGIVDRRGYEFLELQVV